jgi:hypothetical protein
MRRIVAPNVAREPLVLKSARFVFGGKLTDAMTLEAQVAARIDRVIQDTTLVLQQNPITLQKWLVAQDEEEEDEAAALKAADAARKAEVGTEPETEPETEPGTEAGAEAGAEGGDNAHSAPGDATTLLAFVMCGAVVVASSIFGGRT